MAYLVIDQSGKVTAASEVAYPASVVEFYQQQGCTVTTGAYERGYDGQLYRAGGAPQKSPGQLQVEAQAAMQAEIIAALDAIDARGARAARAVALAVAAGDTPSPADVDKLTALETEARALRAELAELQEG